MIKLHKKNLLSLRNKAIRDNKDFKYEIVRVAVIALISGITFAVLITNDAVRETFNMPVGEKNYEIEIKIRPKR